MKWWSWFKKKEDPFQQEWVLKGLQNSFEGFYVIQHGKFFPSTRFLTLVGWEEERVQERDLSWWLDQIHPEDREWFKQFYEQRCQNTSSQNQTEYRIRHRAGYWLWLLIHTHVHKISGKNEVGFLALATDVSSYRVLCQQLERTIEEGEKSSQAKTTFIASLNHELRTPLHGIMGLGQLLKEEPLTGDQEHLVDNILISAKMLLNIVNDILDVSKISSGKFDLEYATFNLEGTLEGIISLLGSLARLKGLELRLKIEPNVPTWVLGDQARLQQILINLVNNAIKFTNTGHVYINVSLGKNMENIWDNNPQTTPQSILFKVIDTGVGIAAEVLPKLFQDFTQADASVSRTHGGTGLGLAICRKLVSLMHGEIGVQSCLNKGSTFWFSLPFTAGEAPDHLINPSQGGIRVLVAEDNLINQKVISGFLKNMGASVTIAQDGEQAIEYLKASYSQGGKNNLFDIILMDINMPKINGEKATEVIRKMEQGKTIPIIACTADTITNTRENFLGMGFTDAISKPISKIELRKILTKYATLEEVTSETRSNASPEIKEESQSITDEKVIQVLKEEMGTETFETLVNIYEQEAEELIKEILALERKAQDPEEQEKLYKSAHTLAGMSENIGFSGIGTLAREIMRIARQREEMPKGIGQKLEESFKEAIKRYCNRE